MRTGGGSSSTDTFEPGRRVDAQITFVTDAQGKATELILHQGGMDYTGKRVP
ncbi:MAG: hypothetical protein WBQ34_18425 [Candidatus Acidiferrales bacterium]